MIASVRYYYVKKGVNWLYTDIQDLQLGDQVKIVDERNNQKSEVKVGRRKIFTVISAPKINDEGYWEVLVK